MSDKIPNTVLFIDDERNIRTLVRMVLEREGFRVRTAEAGSVGLGMCRTEPPDVIILDVVMPSMNGYEVLRQLKAEPLTRDIPVIMLTALGAPRDLSASLNLGAVSHMEKPYRSKELVEEIKLALWKRHNATGQSTTTA